MKVIVGTDIEGVAGIVDFNTQAYDTGKYYEQAKRLLTAEVNAAVEGLIEAGVEEVLVVDGHGPGAIAYEDLKSPAKLMHGRPLTGIIPIGRVIRQSKIVITAKIYHFTAIRQFNDGSHRPLNNRCFFVCSRFMQIVNLIFNFSQYFHYTFSCKKLALSNLTK